METGLPKNIVTCTDSYKKGHHKMALPGTKLVYSYFEARLGAKFPATTFAGLQQLLVDWLAGVVVTKAKIDKAEKFAARHFGNDQLFHRERWDYILEQHGGKLPIKIRAVPEGMVIPIDNMLMDVINTDENCGWLTNHLETLLTHVWYPSTVASLSRATKNVFRKYLDRTSDYGADFPGINFMLHDFGMRGVSSMESAGAGGMAHLINFLGTDTVIAMEFIEHYYGGIETGFSVAASEHSIMTAKGREGEEEVIDHLLTEFPTGILSLVSDSYNIYNCVDNIYGVKFKDRILARDGKLVVRPDSGDPVEVVCGTRSLRNEEVVESADLLPEGVEATAENIKEHSEDWICDLVWAPGEDNKVGDEAAIIVQTSDKRFLVKGVVDTVDKAPEWDAHWRPEDMIITVDELIETPEELGVLQILWNRFGGTTNNKGFKILNPKVGLIWGDGIDIEGIEKVLKAMLANGFSAENICFGMGGGLLQKINRDTQRFAFKCSAQYRDGEWVDVYKDPLDTSKASKRGRLKLVKVNGDFKTVRIDDPKYDAYDDILVTVFENGEVKKLYTFDELVNQSN